LDQEPVNAGDFLGKIAQIGSENEINVPHSRYPRRAQFPRRSFKDEHMNAQRLACIAVALGAMAFFAGCKTTYSTHQLGDQRIVAKYSGRALFAEVPETVRVPAVIAAADEVARARGYTVLKKETTEEKGIITVVPPARDSITQLVIHAERVDVGTSIRVSFQPFPDRQLCESFFDAILAKVSPN
jgi:hypothetical protein